MARSPSGTRGPESDTYKSLGLQALCGKLQDRGGCSMLELGGVLGVNIAFWTRFSPYIHVGNLTQGIPAPQYSDDGSLVDPDWAGILSIPAGRMFDVILAWDLLNYLEQPLVASLIRHLVPFCSPGALLFALIYDRPQMPALPTVFKIVDEERLIYNARSSENRACPRHQPRDVQRMLEGFRRANSFQLRHGVQEYLFEYHPEG